jgi:hypothetical protein
MWVDRCKQCQHDHTGGEQQDGHVYTDILEQETSQREANGLAAEGDQAKDAVDAPLLFVGNDRTAITELHDVVDRPRNERERRDNADHEDIGRDNIERYG